MEEKYICECWNDSPPVDCSGCSCVRIHNKTTKEYFEQNQNRWRKVEEELPKGGFKTLVVARQKVGDSFIYGLGHYAVGEWVFGFSLNPDEWKVL